MSRDLQQPLTIILKGQIFSFGLLGHFHSSEHNTPAQVRMCVHGHTHTDIQITH